MCIKYNKIDGFIKIYNRIRYLVLFDSGWFDKICDRNKYLISEKNGATDSINHNLQGSEFIHVVLYLLKKILTFCNAIILIKSVPNKNENNYYYNIFLEKGLYKDKSNTKYF